jgi:Ni2+-binding GTPase involved in maturation of urease and hydrogenase
MFMASEKSLFVAFRGINTDEFVGDCHLAAHVVEKAAGNFDLDAIDLLIVESVGNLVCPAEFDISEDAKIVVLSVTEVFGPWIDWLKSRVSRKQKKG